jgi:hypothetical protein
MMSCEFTAGPRPGGPCCAKTNLCHRCADGAYWIWPAAIVRSAKRRSGPLSSMRE